MSAKKGIQIVSSLAKTDAGKHLTNLAKASPYAHPSRNNPNAAKLIDGAIQRQAV